jgi:hypothetical protein
MAFMDAPAGVHVMQTLVDDRSIGVQKGVWVSRDAVHWCLLDVTKSFEGVLQLPRCGIHVRRHRCLPAAAFEHCGRIFRLSCVVVYLRGVAPASSSKKALHP